jgi:hypothetical protein
MPDPTQVATVSAWLTAHSASMTPANQQALLSFIAAQVLSTQPPADQQTVFTAMVGAMPDQTVAIMAEMASLAPVTPPAPTTTTTAPAAAPTTTPTA